jgi:coenzyme F420-dependent glucose-6-phosphate dehydrogenase
VIEKILPYVELGFEDLVLHAPGHDQKRFLDQFGADVLPALREEAEKRAS